MIRRLEVIGDSMSPTLNSGDLLLVNIWSRRGSFQADQLVLIQRINRANGERDFIQVKRLTRIEPAGMWVEGDNSNQSTDSRTWGFLQSDEVIGRVLVRYRKAKSPNRN